MADDVWPPEPDGSDAVVSDAAAAARVEWREERDASAYDAFVAFRRSRGFVDHLRECMARGDVVRVRSGEFAAVGAVVDLGTDLVAVRNDGAARIDVRVDGGVPLVVEILARHAGAGRAGAGRGGGFAARLLELEYSDAAVHVWVVGEREPLTGRIEIGSDVVVVNGPAASWVVPLRTVLAVQPAPAS